ncbi:hypothetical protein LCGC14_1279310 [marine sediment metagenome]|uniref:Uncharacterized protein n=1 Tax=marine sediment metagenome TaxID=412755 RepID=A0A0F9KVP8_9ZZZZ
MLKKCNDCGTVLGKDKKSGYYWCIKCKGVREDYDMKYKICLLGKNTGKGIGKNNFIIKLGEGFTKLGHEVIPIRFGELYDYLQIYDLTECFVDKKEIPLRFISYIHNPDFIMVEQTYNRFDISGVDCPVIYQHREYTHFPDIENPDILLGSYPNRLEVFEYYYPNQYSKIPYCDDNFVATNPNMFDPNKKKIIKGITMIGWVTNPFNFADANGLFNRMIVEDQVGFYQDCIKKGYITYIKGGKFERYRELLEQCEAVLIDGGYINAFGRRLFEAMACKTLCIIRVHNTKTRDIFKKMGLTEDMCYFIYEPEDIQDIYDTRDGIENPKKVERAYEWMMNNHTYEIRAKETIEKFEDYKSGTRKCPKFMGYAPHADIKIIDGKVIYTDLI